MLKFGFCWEIKMNVSYKLTVDGDLIRFQAIEWVGKHQYVPEFQYFFLYDVHFSMQQKRGARSMSLTILVESPFVYTHIYSTDSHAHFYCIFFRKIKLKIHLKNRILLENQIYTTNRCKAYSANNMVSTTETIERTQSRSLCFYMTTRKTEPMTLAPIRRTL